MKYWQKIVVFALLSVPVQAQAVFEVYFDFDQDSPNQKSQIELQQWLENQKNLEITLLAGYCDSIGSENYNLKLAQRRLQAVIQLLEKKAIKSAVKLPQIPYGENFKQSLHQADNRKVAIHYQMRNDAASTNQLAASFQKANPGETLTLPNIYFYNNSAQIVPQSQTTLLDLLEVMVANSSLKIEIQGHICCQLVTDVDGISTLRAEAIYKFLVQNKISPQRLSFQGYGVSRPIHPIPERNEAEANANRRVEIKILEK